MGIQVQIGKEDRLTYHPWWDNFLLETGIDDEYDLDSGLAKYNGYNVADSWSIGFTTKEDFLMFVLRFS